MEHGVITRIQQHEPLFVAGHEGRGRVGAEGAFAGDHQVHAAHLRAVAGLGDAGRERVGGALHLAAEGTEPIGVHLRDRVVTGQRQVLQQGRPDHALLAVDGGHAEPGQLLDSRLVGAHDVALDDAKRVEGGAHGVHWPFCFRAASRRGNTRRALPS
jgi:hypothetical protein